MNTRIYKEYRILRPFWAVALLLPLVPLMLFQDLGYCAMGYVVGCLLLGAASFGAEWNHQTMDLLLSQPLSRKRIWRDKIRMLALALGTLGLIYSMSCVALFDRIVADEGFGALYVLIWLALPMVWALGVGPFFALRTGNSIAAFAFSVVTPFVWVVIMGLLFPSDSLTGQAGFAQACCVYAVPLILFAGAGYGLARFQFHHLETAGITGGAIRPIEWLSALVKTPAVVAPADTGGALGKLIRKELRLHEVSFLIAGCFVLLCALIMAYRSVYGAFAIEPFDHALLSELVLFVAFVPAVIIPMLVGAVSVAEERQMGLLEWHLTLPPSRFRQWLIKILTAYGCSIVLGILTPTALVVASEWLCPASLDQAHIKMPAFGYLGFCSISLLLTTVCLVASSLSQTSLRAILLSLGTIALAGVTIGIMDTFDVGKYLLELPALEFLIVPIVMLNIHHFTLVGVGAAVMLLMLGLGYANYRRLETRLRPAIQIVLVSLALVFLPIITPAMLVQFGNIEAISKDTSLSGRTLLAHMRHKDPQRVVAELGLHLDNPASAPAAIATLNRYGGITPSALPLIVGGLTHPNPEVQYGATWGVGKCWTNLQNQSSLFVRARVTLYQNLQNTNTKVAYTTAMVLGRVDTATIIDALNGKPADSTTALVPGAPDNIGNLIREKYVPLLVEMFDQTASDSGGREATTIDLLGKLGPGARQAIPALLKVAQSDRNFITRNGAIKALEKIDPNVVRINNLKLSPERRRGLLNGMDDAMRRRYGLGKPAPDVVRSQNLEATTNAPSQK